MVPHATQFKRQFGIHGRTYVMESVRLQCIWNLYGKSRGHDELFRYFQYHDALKASGCEQTLDDACIDQALTSVGYDIQAVNDCIGDPASYETNDINGHLQTIVNDVDHNKISSVPALFVRGREMQEFHDVIDGTNTISLFQDVCNHIPKHHARPEICDFCDTWCPNKVGDDFHMNTCLWELKCGDDQQTGWAEFYAERHGHNNNPAEPADPAPAPVPSPANNNGNDNSKNTPAPHINTSERPHTDDNDNTQQQPAPAAATDADKATTSSSSDDNDDVATGLGLIASVMAVIFAAGFAALAVMAIRVWRTKMIIDRYVKEQQAMNSGDYGHRDPAFFPEDTELDLDLEPALQYSDHIGGGTTSAPQQANFLPQLT